MRKSFWDARLVTWRQQEGAVWSLSPFHHPGPARGLISRERQEFVPWRAGLLRARLPVAVGSLWHLRFEGCVVSLENYLDGGLS